jgi:hypothetical protein
MRRGKANLEKLKLKKEKICFRRRSESLPALVKAAEFKIK